MVTADEIREYAMSHYILPVRQSREKTTTLTARAVHNGLSLDSRFPAVCSAINAQRFAEGAGVPPTGRKEPCQNSTVVWHFHLV